MESTQITKHRLLWHGYNCWDVRVDGSVLRDGLTKKEAADLVRILQPLKGIIAQVVSRELDRVVQCAQANRDSWKNAA